MERRKPDRTNAQKAKSYSYKYDTKLIQTSRESKVNSSLLAIYGL